MLTARNFVVLTIVIAVVSLGWACFEMAAPPDSGGLGRDSYGTRAHGQRGLFEILSELGIPVERILAPPTAVVGRQATRGFVPAPGVVEGSNHDINAWRMASNCSRSSGRMPERSS